MDPDASKVVTQALSPVTLLADAATTVPEAKVVLAQCLFDGYDLREPDHEAALQTAREAAGAGEPDAIFFLASRLSIGTLPADEVTAWRLFKSTLAAQGCYGDEDAAFGLEPRGSSGPTPLPSAAARSLAVTFWQRYGMQAAARLGCN
jgi:TPR repeat protein